MAAPAVVASLRALVLAAGLYAGAAHAQEVPPPAYQLAAQRAGIPSTVLYAVALQESGIRRNGRIVPWPWSLNVAGQSRRYATRADACASLQRAMRSTPHTRIDAGLGQINLGYHQHRYASACDLLDPYRNLAIAAEILREQHTPGEDWLLAIGRYHRPAGVSLPPATGAAYPATLPACRARAQPPRSSPRARRHPHDDIPSGLTGPARAAGGSAAGLACRRATDRGRRPWRRIGTAVLRGPESSAARQRAGPAADPDAPGSRHAGGRGRDAAGAQRQAHARHRRAAGDRGSGPAAFRGRR